MNNYKLGTFRTELYDFEGEDAKKRIMSDFISYMLARTQSMFKYTGLPDTIPARDLELALQVHGYVGFVRDNEGDLYALWGELGGEQNAYFMPKNIIIANPYLSLKEGNTYTINDDSVVIANDSMYMGLLPMFRKYGTLLAENEISIRLVDINARIVSLISAQDDNTKESAKDFLRLIKEGKQGIIGDAALLESLKVQPYASSQYSQTLISLIELEQYIKASCWNEIGLNANYNMKREAINSNESQLNDDMLLPLIDDMLKQRVEGLEKVNAMFGTNIEVTLDSSWKDRQLEETLEHVEMLQAATGALTPDAPYLPEDVDVEEPEEVEEVEEPEEVEDSPASEIVDKMIEALAEDIAEAEDVEVEEDEKEEGDDDDHDN